MAGHSKWANIQHRKNKQDERRGKVFTKLIREITVAAKLGGPEIESNFRLRTVVDKAQVANLPKDAIQRAIKRGAGGMEGEDMAEIRYEGYGPNGVAVMVDCLTDNKNRTVAEVRHAFTKCGGNLGTDGSVGYLFKPQGQLLFAAKCGEDTVMDIALEAGALDVSTQDDGTFEVSTNPEDFLTVKEAFKARHIEPLHAESTVTPNIWVPVSAEDAEKVVRLIDMLEDLDDVQNVYSNADIPDEAWG